MQAALSMPAPWMTDAAPCAIDRGLALRRQAEAQARLWADASRRALDGAGLGAGQRVLDVGCDCPTMRRLLDDAVGPGGQVVPLDGRGQLCGDALARRRADGAAPANRFGGFGDDDLRHLPSGSGERFDLVLARQVLFHMADPAAALRQLWRWVRPGGVLLVMDQDTTGVRSFPQQPAMERAFRLINGALRRGGRDLETGTRMAALMVEAGLGAADGCDIAGMLTPAGPASAMARAALAGLTPLIERAALADLRALARLDRDLADASRGSHVTRWPDLVSTWKRKPAA